MAATGVNRVNRDFDDFYDDDEELMMPTRPANVPTGRGMGYTNGMPAYRAMGDGMGQVAGTRTAVAPNVPPPIPNAGVRPRVANVPQPGVRPTGSQRALAPMADPYRRRVAAPRSNPLSNLNVAAGLLNTKMVMLVAGTLAVFLLGFFLVSNVVNWWSTWQDDMTYGRPRTYQTDAWVGHSEQTGTPSHFIAENLHNQVVIFEIPGGDATHTKVIMGPPLYFKGSDLAPVTLSFKDMNADGNVDMIVTVEGQHFVYVNDNGNFRPITDTERAKLNVSSLDGGNK